jgi:FkbM family methyltransferase
VRQIAKSVLRSLNQVAEAAGVQVVRKGRLGRDWDVLFDHLKQLGFDPQLIIDVGVASGTDDIYRHFPRAKYYLVEALAEFEPHLKRLCGRLNAQYFLAAAGSQAGTIQINVHPDLIGSSVHREVDGGGIDGQTRTVDVIRIDDLVQADNKGSRMIKVDVQGAELQVLDGAQQCLRDTDVVILETSLIGTLQDTPELSEVVRYMKDRGFVVFDIIGGEQRPLDRSLAQVDLVFIPQSHPLRADRRWQRIG